MSKQFLWDPAWWLGMVVVAALGVMMVRCALGVPMDWGNEAPESEET